MWDRLEPPFDDGSDRPVQPPPGDRAWRHPSELRGNPGSAPTAGPNGHPASVRLFVASFLGLGLVLFGTLALAGALADDPEPDPVASQVRDLVYMSSSTTAEPGRSGWLGISAVEEEGREGVTVTECDRGSPAESRLREGDLIVAVDDVPTPRMAELVTVLAASPPGHTARILVERDGRSLLVPVVLGRQP